MGYCVNRASSIMPFFTLYFGPFGPSGVIATSNPCCKSLMIPRIEEILFFLYDPLIVPMLKNLIILAMNSPSLWRLMSTLAFPRIFANGIMRSLPCQKHTIVLIFLLHKSCTGSWCICSIFTEARNKRRSM